MTAERPTGIKWSRTGDTVTGTVIVVNANGSQSEVATVRYTLEQAAQMTTQLISALGGKA